MRTKHLMIIPFAERHLSERYVGWLNDAELVRFSEQRHRVHTLASCRSYWQSFANTPHFFWAMEEVAMGLGHIGNITAYVDSNNQLADLGIIIGESKARGKGYALEAWQAVCAFLFCEAGIRKISAGALSVNGPMCKLMQRAGMIDDGRRRAHYLFAGDAVDVVHMALFRETSPSQNNPQDMNP